MKNNSLLTYFSQQVNLYLDNRLTQDSEQNLLDAIQSDSECNQVYNKEKQFRDFIKSNIKRPSASQDLIKSIKKQMD